MPLECDQTPVGESDLPDNTCGIDVKRIYEETIDPNLVRMGTGLSNGSGFLVSNEGQDCLIVSANHVVRGAPIMPVSVSNQESSIFLATPVARDEVHDLVALRMTADFSCAGIPLAVSSAGLSDGTGIMASGYPMTTGVETVTPGIYRGLVPHPDPDDLGPHELATNMYLKTEHKIVGGNSGGPIVNGAGEATGVISRSNHKDAAYSVPVEHIWQMLRSVPGWENAGKKR